MGDSIEKTIHILEMDFSKDLKCGLNELAEEIAKSGLTIAAIAKATRLHWETVYHAASGIPVRFDSYRRLTFFLDKYNSNSLSNGTKE